MKLPTFLRTNRFGIYYLRVSVPRKLRRKFDDSRKEIRVSLNTSKKREALEYGCALYSEFQSLFLRTQTMTKLIWEGKEIDAAEWYERNTQRLKAKEALRKSRNKQRIEGYYDEALDGLLTEGERQSLNHPQQAQGAPIGKHRIADVLQRYIDEKKAYGDWTNKSEDVVRSVFRIFSEIMGDRYFDLIRFPDMLRYQEIILKLPKNVNSEKRYQGKPITEIIQLDNVELLSNKTRNRHFGTMSTLFKWAVTRGFTDQNYASGFTIKRDKKKKKVREIFTKDELQKIVCGDEYTRKDGKRHKKHAYFWCPLISMFTGARLNEICQLKVSDIRQEEGIWYFAFCSEGEEVAKTEAAIRNVPIHEMLIKFGFLNFVKSQKRNKHERLFHDLIKHSKNGYGAQVGKWFNRGYLINCGVKDPEKDSNKKVFHSFRHTVIHHLQQKGVEEKRIKAIEGHVIDDLSYYQHGFGLKLLADEVVANIDYGLDFSHLLDNSKNDYLKT